MNILKKHYLVIVFILFYIFLFGTKLVTDPQPFFDWDESIYAEVGKEMVAKKSLVPLWQYETWLDKPPLVPLFYGLLMAATPFIQPEISTRVASLLLASIALLLVYILYYRVLKNTLLSTTIVILTSFTSIILQRALVLNIDIFLLIGWLGYVLFYERFKLSLFFLVVAVLSKSLIGFYAPGIVAIYFTFLFVTKKIDTKELLNQAKKITIHVSILLMWYVIMFAIYGQDFWIQHVYESHTKRVTASIESHFGRREYYITLLYEYFGNFAWVSIVGVLALLYQWYKKQITEKTLLYALFLFPWFLFLNLTKTKIFWYSHPYIPQFAFLILYPLSLIEKINKQLFTLIVFIVAVAILNFYLVKQQVYSANYSTREPHHNLAEYAKNRCDTLTMLMDETERKKIAELRSMDLTITTTTWWGQHPSMVYYFEKKIYFIYTLDEFQQALEKKTDRDCFTITKKDERYISGDKQLKYLKSFDSVYLYRTELK